MYTKGKIKKKKRRFLFVEASAPPGQASHSPWKHPEGRVPLLQLGCCDYGSSILDQPSRPTTLISVGVIGISADLMVLGKSLNKVFTSFSHLIQAKNS